ncbi:amidohydrolase 3 [Pyrenochaeta sp. MPI-SDFR-AT-0127]|nr:amidohydrolase 3 [Pyrenochaeta sp. MPI-SDFR-AT-0127]
MAREQVFVNGRVFASSGASEKAVDFADCIVVEDDKILHTGSQQDAEVQQSIQRGAGIIDLENRVVVPGLIDAHTHLLFFGLSRNKLDLTHRRSLEEVRRAISEYAKSHPNLPRILCRGWHQPSTGRFALATMLDDLDPRPIYVEALDLHSSWVNTAALKELPLDNIKELGTHQVACDENGQPTGLFAEAGQVDIIWPFLNALYTTEDKQAALKSAFDAYVAAGYTGAIDMAMDHNAWDALRLYRERNGELPIHVAAHWLITAPGSGGDMSEKVDEAIAQLQQWHPTKSPDFCIVGIKLICDGVVDGCTAALSHPYTGHVDLVQPLWPADVMDSVVSRAAQAGLQVAVHAIGDAAVSQAVNAIAKANTPNGRHRIEHLEITSEEDAKRLGQYGITASVQPVHSDPAILQDYPKLIGAESWERAFAYKEFLDGGACVAFGTDAPTALHFPMPNLYNATTRKSATRPELTTQTTPHQAFTISQAFHAATSGAAYSRFAEQWTGTLKKGLQADFVVLDCKWTPETLLEAQVEQTWSRGKKLYQQA